MLHCVFSAPPGARQSLREAGEDDLETDNPSNLSQNYVSEHEPTTVRMRRNDSTALVTQDINIVGGDVSSSRHEPFGFSVKIVPTKKIHEDNTAFVLIICSVPPRWRRLSGVVPKRTSRKRCTQVGKKPWKNKHQTRKLILLRYRIEPI